MWSFFPQAPRRHSSPSLSTRRNQLSPRSPSSRKPSNVQLVPACVASGNIDNAVSRHLDKNRTKHRRTVFSMKKPKRASSDQRTDEEDTSETCNNNHVGGRALTNVHKRNCGWTYIYVLGHRDGRFCDVYIRPVAVNGLNYLRFSTTCVSPCPLTILPTTCTLLHTFRSAHFSPNHRHVLKKRCASLNKMYYPGQKKKTTNNHGYASCDIEESAV